jgi:hypothetical protein
VETREPAFADSSIAFAMPLTHLSDTSGSTNQRI